MPRRPPPDSEYLFTAMARMCALIELDSAKSALQLGEKILDGPRPLAPRPPAPPQEEKRKRTRKKRNPLPRERLRQQLFNMARPEMFLAPANVVAVYLRDHAMCPSWDWADTAALNARMLPVVQAMLGDPGIDDPRVALAFSIAGLFLYRALVKHMAGELLDRPERDFLEEVYEVYGEIWDGLETIHDQVTAMIDGAPRGEVSEPLAYEWFVFDTAKLLLLRAVGLGEPMWRLILLCPLGSHCHKRQPFYVPAVRPDEDRHGACRTAAARQRRSRRV